MCYAEDVGSGITCMVVVGDEFVGETAARGSWRGVTNGAIQEKHYMNYVSFEIYYIISICVCAVECAGSHRIALATSLGCNKKYRYRTNTASVEDSTVS